MVVRNFLVLLLLIFLIPLGLYLLVFYVHLSILTKAGPHDNVLTSAFQASLEVGAVCIRFIQIYFFSKYSRFTPYTVNLSRSEVVHLCIILFNTLYIHVCGYFTIPYHV